MTNEEAANVMEKYTEEYCGKTISKVVSDAHKMAIIALEHDRWIPFKLIEGTNMLQEPIPKDGQEILIAVNIEGHEPVQQDTFYLDSGGCYLDSQYSIIEDVPAWRPLPEPYKESEGEHEQRD